MYEHQYILSCEGGFYVYNVRGEYSSLCCNEYVQGIEGGN